MLRNPADKQQAIFLNAAHERLKAAADLTSDPGDETASTKAGIVQADGTITVCGIVGLTPVGYGADAFQTCRRTYEETEWF